jgi:hypothetical protein
MTRAALLEQLEAALLGYRPLDPEIAAAIVRGLRSGSIDKELGLCRARNRHEKIKSAVPKFYAQRSLTAAADEFHRDWSDFASTSWIRERGLLECPHRHTGTARAVFWDLLKANDAVLSARQLRKILSL